jgi:hypothetical protein
VTEHDWISSTDPDAMLDFLRGRGMAGDRKLRLFAAACCRRIWHLLEDPRSRQGIEIAEAFADGLASLERMEEAAASFVDPSPEPDREYAAQAHLIRDLFGLWPFRPLPTLAAALLAWHDGLIVRLAQAAYDHRLLPSGHLDPARLSVLADALLEAGCPPDHELLLHLWGPGPHVRGCWAIDVLTGGK